MSCFFSLTWAHDLKRHFPISFYSFFFFEVLKPEALNFLGRCSTIWDPLNFFSVCHVASSLHCQMQFPSKYLKSLSAPEGSKNQLTPNQRFSVAASSATRTPGSGASRRRSWQWRLCCSSTGGSTSKELSGKAKFTWAPHHHCHREPAIRPQSQSESKQSKMPPDNLTKLTGIPQALSSLPSFSSKASVWGCWKHPQASSTSAQHL
jgi:hypothetical protein